MTRMAISPRLAISIRRNGGLMGQLSCKSRAQGARQVVLEAAAIRGLQAFLLKERFGRLGREGRECQRIVPGRLEQARAVLAREGARVLGVADARTVQLAQ